MLHGMCSAVAYGFAEKFRDVQAFLDVCEKSWVRGHSGSGVAFTGVDSMSEFRCLRVRKKSESLRINSSPSNSSHSTGGDIPVAILCLWGRKHDSRQNTLGSLAGVKKQRGDEKVEITLNLEVLKHQAGKTVVNTKRALVSSARMARQVGQYNLCTRCFSRMCTRLCHLTFEHAISIIVCFILIPLKHILNNHRTSFLLFSKTHHFSTIGSTENYKIIVPTEIRRVE